MPPNSRATIEAAGVVLWRPSRKHGIKVAIIHRPGYDDWSLPKGKAEPGEAPAQTAWRETYEETGFTARLGRHVDTISYATSAGVKRVHYFAGQAIAGEFVANKEVDRLLWLPVAKARMQLSYPRDRTLLDSFVTLPAALATVVLVRHGKAGQRDSFPGADSKRPLDRRGRRQAEDLAALLKTFCPTIVSAAPLERCRQTVAPLAAGLGLAVTDEPSFSEVEYLHDPTAARRRTVDLAVGTLDRGLAVVCSQGGVIPGVVRALAAKADLAIESTTTPKGSYWVLSFDDKRLCQADHYLLSEN